MNSSVVPTPPSPYDINASQAPPSLADPETFRQKFDQLHTQFTENVVARVISDRALRDMLVDVEAAEEVGAIGTGQTYIAQRVIDTNIARDMPEHVAYLTQSRRAALFIPVNKHIVDDTTELETEFHRVMTYGDYITEYTRCADSAKLHGFGFVDYTFDDSCPGHVSVEFIPADYLFFDVRVKNIQQSPLIARMYEITQVDLYDLNVQYKFDPAVYTELFRLLSEPLSTVGNSFSTDERNRIYRVFYKEGGQVFAGWWSKQLCKYLKMPELFYNGVSMEIEEMPPIDPLNPTLTVEPIKKWVPKPATKYPYNAYLNRITEVEQIIKIPGRAMLDEYLQEATSSIVTSIVNGSNEAANVMWCPKETNPENPTAPKQLTFQVKHGAIWTTPMVPFSPPYPPAQLMGVNEMLRVQNAEDTGNVSFATNNRKDTRKTAAEIKQADKQDSTMATMPVTAWATFLGELYNDVWPIVQSEALQGKIQFCADANGQNNLELIGQEYKLIPAGTIDYVERMERIDSMQSDMEIVLPTAAGPAFLEEYLRIKYPDLSQKFVGPLQQQQAQSSQALQACIALLKAAVLDENGNLMPEWQSQAKVLAQFGITPGADQQKPTGQNANNTGLTPTNQIPPAQ